MNLNKQLRANANAVEAALTKACRPGEEPQKELFAAMAYSALAGGKRLRPFLVQEFCRLCGGTQENGMAAATAIEMIHTYSLIHDDLPCMDNDDYRRGKLTNHKVYGEAMAILAGDGLLTDAFWVLSQAQLPAQAVCRCVQILAQNAGSHGMVGGQALDITAEKRACTAEEICNIQRRKTGGLIRAACQMGVICGGGSEAQLTAAGQYADALGLAFQIRDDMLDVEGNAQELGKATGMDGDKNTFVRLYGLERCRALVLAETQKAVDALADFPGGDTLRELALYLRDRKT